MSKFYDSTQIMNAYFDVFSKGYMRNRAVYPYNRVCDNVTNYYNAVNLTDVCNASQM